MWRASGEFGCGRRWGAGRNFLEESFRRRIRETRLTWEGTGQRGVMQRPMWEDDGSGKYSAKRRKKWLRKIGNPRIPARCLLVPINAQKSVCKKHIVYRREEIPIKLEQLSAILLKLSVLDWLSPPTPTIR